MLEFCPCCSRNMLPGVLASSWCPHCGYYECIDVHPREWPTGLDPESAHLGAAVFDKQDEYHLKRKFGAIASKPYDVLPHEARTTSTERKAFSTILREMKRQSFALNEWDNYANAALGEASIMRIECNYDAALPLLIDSAILGALSLTVSFSEYLQGVDRNSMSTPTLLQIIDCAWQIEISKSNFIELIKSRLMLIPALRNWEYRAQASDTLVSLVFGQSVPKK